MSALSSLTIHDLRPRLEVKPIADGLDNIRRPRRGPVIGATLHYNGPALAFVPDPARELNFVVNTDTAEHQKRIGGDSLMYHFVVLSDGQIWQTRNLEYPAWHCGNSIGNERSLAVHLPIGGNQQPTAVQWLSVERLLDALAADYGFTRADVVGHNEWPRVTGAARPSATYRVLPKQSGCPGRAVHTKLVEYRAGKPANQPSRETWVSLWHAPVRQAPRVSFDNGLPVPIAGWLTPGQEVEVDLLKSDGDAQEIKGVREWLHLANGLGFVWRPNCEKKDG